MSVNTNSTAGQDPQKTTLYSLAPQASGTSGGDGTEEPPSIITTITKNKHIGPVTGIRDNRQNNVESVTKQKRPTEVYESYIEDSFVGHWEREDDEDDYDTEYGDDRDARGFGSDNHPAMEFSFDSFGPESIIFTPKQVSHTNNQQGHDDSPTEQQPLQPEQVVVETVTQSNSETGAGTPQLINDNQPEEQDGPSNGDPDLRAGPSKQRSPPKLTPIECLVDISQIDMRVIEPYKKVISHAGYCHHYDPTIPPSKPGDPAPAIIVFSACYLPDRSRRDYNYVMDHLFLYVLSSLHELIADDYILIYLHNTRPSSAMSKTFPAGQTVDSTSQADEAQQSNNLPTFTWIKRCYQMIDRKLKKNLRILYLVRPTFWLKTLVIMCKPFISAKFGKKLRFIDSMDSLKKCLPVEKLILPASADNL